MSALSAVASSDGELARWNTVLGRKSAPVVNKSPTSHGALHLVAPVLPKQSEAERADKHQPTTGKTFGVVTKTEVLDKIAIALKTVPSAKHVVARLEGTAETLPSVDTAEGWRSGLNIPGGYNLIVLARQFPEVRAVVRQLIDSEFDSDPRAYSLFLEAMRYAREAAK